VTAEAITDLLRTRTERSALPTPFSLKDGRAVPSSPLTIPLHPPPQLPSFLTVESLAPTLLKPFVHSIETTLIPNVPSLDDYSCVICMNIAFKPVRLSCTHLFCVRCLVKMQKRGEGNCPLCRAQSVLCANSSEWFFFPPFNPGLFLVTVDVDWIKNVTYQRTWIGLCSILWKIGFLEKLGRN